jgi:hypothetical protein
MGVMLPPPLVSWPARAYATNVPDFCGAYNTDFRTTIRAEGGDITHLSGGVREKTHTAHPDSTPSAARRRAGSLPSAAPAAPHHHDPSPMVQAV